MSHIQKLPSSVPETAKWCSGDIWQVVTIELWVAVHYNKLLHVCAHKCHEDSTHVAVSVMCPYSSNTLGHKSKTMLGESSLASMNTEQAPH